MKKSGFTMIELIFVIVIIGILAAVAIPKLAATRTDAQISAISQEVQSAIQEIGTYITAQGGKVKDTNFTVMSQTLKQLKEQGKTSPEYDMYHGHTEKRISIYADGVNPCVIFESNATGLQVSTNPKANGLICKGVKKIIKDVNYTFIGHKVKF